MSLNSKIRPESNSRPHALVIGGSGFIGSHLIPMLAGRGYTLTVLDKRPAPPEVQTVARCLIGDVRCYDDVAAAMKGKSVVYNLAAEHQDNVHPKSLYDEVNVEGARVLCRSAEDLGINRIVFTSSVAVYGSWPGPMDEETPHAYFNDYGRTKHLAEEIYKTWLNGSRERCLAIVRPTVVFGPGNRGNVYNFIRQMKHGPFVMFGDGLNVKSMAHVDNVAAFLAHLADANERYLVYNYADKPDFNMRDLVAFVNHTLGRGSGTPISVPKSLGLLIGNAADVLAHAIHRPLPVSAIRIQKFCSASEIDAQRAAATGFRPVKSLQEGLREMILHHT